MLKKKLIAASLLAALAIPSAAFAYNKAVVFKIGVSEVSFQVNVAGSDLWEYYTMDVAPTVIDSRTFIPVRYTALAMGVPAQNISWEQETQKVTVFDASGRKIELWVGQNEYKLYETDNTIHTVPMDVSPVIVKDRVLLPVRYLAEAFGKDVNWDPQTQTITIR